MPNGHHYTPEEWAGVVSFFEAIAEPLNAFANRRNLVIDKYYHNAADWTFRFAHPVGGNGQIQVMRVGDGSLWIALSWYIDDYNSFTRSIKYDTWKNISPDTEALTVLLENALATILGWKLGEWTEVFGSNEYPWGQYTKKEWDRMQPAYPLPRMDER